MSASMCIQASCTTLSLPSPDPRYSCRRPKPRVCVRSTHCLGLPLLPKDTHLLNLPQGYHSTPAERQRLYSRELPRLARFLLVRTSQGAFRQCHGRNLARGKPSETTGCQPEQGAC